MKITVISWKDERWSADKESLKSINKLINRNTNRMKYPIGEKIFLAIGWIAISPFLLSDLIVRGFKWLVRKRKN
jgi:uncharacterized protein YggT (Ycf19 family)